MYQIDRDFISLKIFALSGRNEAVVANQCPRSTCGRPYEETISLSEFEVVSWPEDKAPHVDFVLPDGMLYEGILQKEGKLRFPTGKEQELMGAMENPAQLVDSMLSSCIIKLGTLSHIDTERAKRLSKRDREWLMDSIKYDLPGIRQWKTVVCDCGCEFEAVLDVTSFFGGRRRRMKK
jgi:hypothetical protein